MLNEQRKLAIAIDQRRRKPLNETKINRASWIENGRPACIRFVRLEQFLAIGDLAY